MEVAGVSQHHDRPPTRKALLVPNKTQARSHLTRHNARCLASKPLFTTPKEEPTTSLCWRVLNCNLRPKNKVGHIRAMHEIPQIEVELTFLTEAEGGREQPPVFTTPTMYRPHLIVAGSTVYLGVIFQIAPEFVQPQVPFTATLGLFLYPKVDYAGLTPEAEFTVREGARVVARGSVTKRFHDTAILSKTDPKHSPA